MASASVAVSRSSRPRTPPADGGMPRRVGSLRQKRDSGERAKRDHRCGTITRKRGQHAPDHSAPTKTTTAPPPQTTLPTPGWTQRRINERRRWRRAGSSGNNAAAGTASVAAALVCPDTRERTKETGFALPGRPTHSPSNAYFFSRHRDRFLFPPKTHRSAAFRPQRLRNLPQESHYPRQLTPRRLADPGEPPRTHS
ncbi:hypothetical protein HPB51_011782 [Rhipicephalus microplus]|uniref:Uncharacterized protein n=1 Tax=Rhipicephalus microplus TaxID=6941 RepID=A0A9J6DG86_RHIMP|nr:hypothetical protein HPB51_011782 [Rhipicephalus microplus]